MFLKLHKGADYQVTDPDLKEIWRYLTPLCGSGIERGNGHVPCKQWQVCINPYHYQLTRSAPVRPRQPTATSSVSSPGLSTPRRSTVASPYDRVPVSGAVPVGNAAPAGARPHAKLKLATASRPVSMQGQVEPPSVSSAAFGGLMGPPATRMAYPFPQGGVYAPPYGYGMPYAMPAHSRAPDMPGMMWPQPFMAPMVYYPQGVMPTSAPVASSSYPKQETLAASTSLA